MEPWVDPTLTGSVVMRQLTELWVDPAPTGSVTMVEVGVNSNSLAMAGDS